MFTYILDEMYTSTRVLIISIIYLLFRDGKRFCTCVSNKLFWFNFTYLVCQINLMTYFSSIKFVLNIYLIP